MGLLFFAGVGTAGSMDDYLFAPHNEFRHWLQMPETPRAPWFEDAELRFKPERDARDLSSESYSFRFRPTSSKERQAMRSLFSVESSIARAEWRDALNDVMVRRYHSVIDLAELEVRTAVLRRRLAFDRLLLSAESSRTASSTSNTVDLQDASLRVERRTREISRSVHKVSQLRAATVSDLLAVGDADRPAVSEKLVPPEQIEGGLEALDAWASTYIAELVQMKVRRAQTEVELEKIRSRFGIDLLELSFEDKPTDSYSVTLGFRIPLGRGNFGLKRRMREANLARNNAHFAEQLFTDELRNVTRRVRWKIEDYSMDIAAIEAVQDRIQSAAADVASLVSLRQHELDLLNSAADTHLSLLRDYVNLLAMLGALQQQKNWIESDSI